MHASPMPPNGSGLSEMFPPPDAGPGPTLLFDENFAHRLPDLLADVYPSSSLRAEGLEGAEDSRVWAHAAAGGFLLVTKDEDFLRLSLLNGWPPKVVLIKLGNCLTAEIADLLRRSLADVIDFTGDDRAGVLRLG